MERITNIETIRDKFFDQKNEMTIKFPHWNTLKDARLTIFANVSMYAIALN